MKALLSRTCGGPDTLEIADLPEPAPAPGEVRIAVRACGLNFLDTLIIKDEYQLKPARPFAPGVEVCGVIDALGDGTSGWAVGDRVIAILPYGGLCEQVCVSAERVFALPGSLSFEQGAGLLLTYGTSLHALADRGRIQPDETLLVLGAGGGAGLSAVELGKALGLRVIAAVSGEDKAAAARAAGADDVVLYGRDAFDVQASRAFLSALRAACGGDGANIVYDAVGGQYAEPALRVMAWGGRYLIVGFAAGIPALPFNLALLKSVDLCGVFYGGFMDRDPAANAVLAAKLCAMAAEGRIAPHVRATYPLSRAGEAIAALGDRSAIGKLVVTMGD